MPDCFLADNSRHCEAARHSAETSSVFMLSMTEKWLLTEASYLRDMRKQISISFKILSF